MGPEPKTTHQWLSASLFCISHATMKLLTGPPNRQFKIAEQGIPRCRHNAMFASDAKLRTLPKNAKYPCLSTAVSRQSNLHSQLSAPNKTP